MKQRQSMKLAMEDEDGRYARGNRSIMGGFNDYEEDDFGIFV